MIIRQAIGCAILVSAGLLPVTAYAQNVNITRSVLADQPYTLIYPDSMSASGGGDQPLSLSHPDAPIYCDLTIVPVTSTDWTADSALAELDDTEVTANWSGTFPGFTLGTKAVKSYQSGPALYYDAQSTDSPMGMPLTIVHTQTVDGGHGYVLDCLYSTAIAAEARPVVDFIIANFSTKADAECCVGAVAEPSAAAPAPAPQ